MEFVWNFVTFNYCTLEMPKFPAVMHIGFYERIESLMVISI